MAAPEPPAPPEPVQRRDREGERTVAKDSPKDHETVFRRPEPEAPVKPTPQQDNAARDLVRSKLAALNPTKKDRRTTIAKVKAPVFGKAPAPAPAVKDTTRVDLVRQDKMLNKPSKPRNLNRNVPLPTSLPKAAIVQPTVAVAPRPNLDDPGSVRQVLEGATLAGPVADRPIVQYRPPDYPEWAKQEAVEGSVRLHFTVLPDGQVKRNVLVEKTSGFEDFDQNAKLALLDWEFEPLPGGASGEQWGTITLNYRLDDAR